MKNQYETICQTATEAALLAGKYLRNIYNEPKTVEFKGEVDLVTQCDRKSQEIIYDFLKKKFPQHSVLAEEDLEVHKDKDRLWIIDPIDGTTNFAHSLPMFCISIAFMESETIQAGVIYIPLLNEMFTAIKGNGAFLNNQPLHVTAQTQMDNSLLATGFPYDRRQNIDRYIRPFRTFLSRSRGIRRMGSAAIDLAFTAAGRFDGYWEYNLHPWDCAAGFLLVEEAGGKVTDFSGNPFNPFMKECLASNSLIHPQMLDILKSCQEDITHA